MRKIIFCIVLALLGLATMCILIYFGHTEGYLKFQKQARQVPEIDLMFRKKKNVRLYGKSFDYLVARITFLSRKVMLIKERQLYREKKIMGALYVQVETAESGDPKPETVQFFKQWKPDGFRQANGILAQLKRDGSVNSNREDIEKIDKQTFMKLLTQGVKGFAESPAK